MIALSRVLARQLRAVLRQTTPPRCPRTCRLPLDLHAGPEGLCVRLQHPGVAVTRTTRLLSALKLQRRQSRALQAAVASLKQLQLDR